MEYGEPVQLSEMRTRDGCELAIARLLDMSPNDIARNDISVLNLLCAPLLPGSEDLDILKCLGRFGNLVAFVREGLKRYADQLRQHPHYACEAEETMAMIITLVKRDYGAAYSPTARDDLLAGDRHSPFTDASEVLIHGLLRDDKDRRLGTCSSIPVLLTAVARRLGFPVALAVTRNHVFCRWDDGRGTRFNIEASNPQGMTVPTDEEYRNWPNKLTWDEIKSGYYMRSLTPAEEFASFIKGRVYCMLDAGYYDATWRWVARAMQLAPNDPNFHHDAMVMVDMAIKHRHWRKFPEKKLPACDSHNQPFFQIGKYLEWHEGPCWFTIMAHCHEQKGDLDKARYHFEEACRYSPHGYPEHRDFQRFLKKHDLEPKAKPLMPPKGLAINRFFRLTCPPAKEADELRLAAASLERRGQLLQAHDALHDLYLFDPADDEVFWHCRNLEYNPWYRTQLDAQLAATKTMAKNLNNTFGKFNGGPSRVIDIPKGSLQVVRPYENKEYFTVNNR